MRQYLKHDEWKIIEEGFNPEYHEASESIFSLGNGHMGQRANFEEQYSGRSLQGSYIAGVYYPDKTKVGWWKNGYPEYFAKVLNSPNWIGIDVEVDGVRLDLCTAKVENFTRTLDMKQGTLSRTFTATLENGRQINVETLRFLSMDNPECGLVRYSVTPLNFSGKLVFTPFIDGNVANRDSNYDEIFWNILQSKAINGKAWLLSQTKKLDFRVSFAMMWKLNIDACLVTASSSSLKCENRIETLCIKAQTVSIEKYVAVCSSLNHKPEQLVAAARKKAAQIHAAGFDTMLKNHIKRWDDIWQQSDIRIKGDIAAQQGIRFNIFHLNQTYTGSDERLNIGPKGFTGEKYGGSTYWDTEAWCIPFFITTAPSHVTRNLLMYRYKHLPKAIENAKKLGFTGGAALYPMVTMTGEECHNEWEITFEEIHRNGAIAFAIYNYVRHTGDELYLQQYGMEVLIAISRFWAQRTTFSKEKDRYVILGVTGPNEYENNVNNNWYTNRIAVWTLRYTLESLERIKKTAYWEYEAIAAKTQFAFRDETPRWANIIWNMYFPNSYEAGIFLQQEGYMDKEQQLVSSLPPEQRPINQHWSWDRILRSCFIKQADVLQGIYLFEDEFDTETIRRHFDFYEPRTVHESSLSPCVHAIIAARVGYSAKACEMYLRTARLDLDDCNSEVHEGLHITSMAGTWMSIVEGFGGKRIKNGSLHFNPVIPHQWNEYSFTVLFRENRIKVKVNSQQVTFISYSANRIIFFVYSDMIVLKPEATATVPIRSME